MKIDKQEYERLQYVYYNYGKLKELIKQLYDEMTALEIIMNHDLKEAEEDIEEI